MRTVRNTSIEAYNQIKENNLLSKLRFEVYHALFHHGPLTQGELWSRYFPDKQRHSICPRFKELLDRDVIECVGERPCGYTGVQSMVWDVNAKLPKKIRTTKPPTKLEMIKALHERLTNVIHHFDAQRRQISEPWIMRTEETRRIWTEETRTLLMQCEKTFLYK